MHTVPGTPTLAIKKQPPLNHTDAYVGLPAYRSRQIRLLAAADAQSSLFVASSAILVVVASLVRWLQDGVKLQTCT